MNLFNVFKKTPPVDPAEQCSKCRKAVGNVSMREHMLRLYGNEPSKVQLIATGQIEDPQNMIMAEAVGAAGFICQQCRKKYCAQCGGGMNFICCGTKLYIGTHY